MNNKIKLIAETAWHHEGDFKFFVDLVSNIITKSKADIIKYHLLLDLDEYMDSGYNLYNILKKWMLSKEQWTDILTTTNKSEKELMLLFNDSKSIEFGMKFNPTLVEIHSTCLNDFYLLEKLKFCIQKHQKIVLGIGGSSINEIENALDILQHDKIILMFGFQNYPTKYSDINLRKMRRIMNLFPEYEYGYADHTAWNEKDNILITLLGAATGMNYIEKHISTKYGEERCDWQAAVNIDMFNEIADKLEILSEINGDGYMRLNEGEKKYSLFGPMKKAAITSKEIKKGEKFNRDMILFKRSHEISDLSQIDVTEMFGKEFSVDISINSVIKKEFFNK